jgi:hypothetical protein
MGKKVGGLLGVMGKAAQGSRKGSAVHDGEMVQEMVAAFGLNRGVIQPVNDPFTSVTSFNSPQAAAGFGTEHCAGPVTYNVADWIESDCDALGCWILKNLEGRERGLFKR